jgi:hypothetical protein
LLIGKVSTSGGFLDLLSSSEPSNLFDIDDDTDILGRNKSKSEEKSSSSQTAEKAQSKAEDKESSKQQTTQKPKDPFTVLFGSNRTLIKFFSLYLFFFSLSSLNKETNRISFCFELN